MRRLIVCIYGADKSGKTHWSLTAARVAPVFFLNLNAGLEGVLSKARGPVEVTDLFPKRAAAPTSEESRAAAFGKLWAEFVGAYSAAVTRASKVGGVVVVDTETEAWELCRAARFGRLLQVPRHLYPPVNLEYQSLIMSAYNPGVSLVLVDSLKDEYSHDIPTGGKTRAGFSKVPGLVQIMLETIKRPAGQDRFGVRVVLCRHNPDLEGMELFGPAASFEALMDLLS